MSDLLISFSLSSILRQTKRSRAAIYAQGTLAGGTVGDEYERRDPRQRDGAMWRRRTRAQRVLPKERRLRAVIYQRRAVVVASPPTALRVGRTRLVPRRRLAAAAGIATAQWSGGRRGRRERHGWRARRAGGRAARHARQLTVILVVG